MLSFFPRGVLDEILNLIESVSESFPSYSCLGCFQNFSLKSLLAEANKPSLYSRRLKLSMQYALKLKSNPSNPTYENVFEPQYENKANYIPSFGIRISSEFENMNLDLDSIAEFKIPDVPPWTFSQPRVLFSLHNDK